MDKITSIDQVHNYLLVGHINYQYNNVHNAYFNPKYLISDTGLVEVDRSAFPDSGSIQIIVHGYGTQRNEYTNIEMEEDFGDLVCVKLNDVPRTYFNQAYDTGKSDNRYLTFYNHGEPNYKALITINKFTDSQASMKLFQVIRPENLLDINLMKASNKAFIRCDDEVYTKYILIAQTEGSSQVLYGPFNYTYKESGLEIHAENKFDFIVNEVKSNDTLNSARIEDCDCQTVVLVSQKEYEEFLDSNAHDVYDLMPIDKIKDIVIESIDKNLLNNAQFKQLNEILDDYSKFITDKNITPTRINKVKDFVNTTNMLKQLPQDVRSNVIQSIPQDELVELFLNEDNFNRFKERLLEDEEIKDTIDEELNKQTAEVGKLEKQKEELEASIAKAQSVIDKTQSEYRKSALSEIKSQISDKQAELDTKTKQVEDITNKIATLTKELENKKFDSMTIEKSLENVLAEFEDAPKLYENVMTFELINQCISRVTNKVEAPSTFNDVVEVPSTTTTIYDVVDDISVDDYIENVVQYINEKGNRSYNRNEIVNLLVCVAQGYITTFAGKPGTGKTTLCNLLASSLGLSNTRYNKVSVELDWTSYRDWIGYYNPLSNTNQIVNADVYSSLVNMQTETDLSKYPMQMVLLDEANLSPLEHYWGPFMGACDSFLQDGTDLYLGGPTKISIPEHLRFLATVNFDHTTEELSNRFLDRSWVVMLEPEAININFDVNKANDIKPIRLSYSKFIDFFGVAGDPKYLKPKQDVWDKFVRLVDMCNKGGLNVSQRSQMMILNYVAVASKYMDIDSLNMEYLPLDFAVSQKVLPQINGDKYSLETLIANLIAETETVMPITHKHLLRIRENGELNGYYQYFN